jgi:hypothetical protein
MTVGIPRRAFEASSDNTQSSLSYKVKRTYDVVGLDNFSEYGRVRKSYEDNPHYTLVEGNARDVGLMISLLADYERVLGFGARTMLDDLLDEVIPWVSQAAEAGTI